MRSPPSSCSEMFFSSPPRFTGKSPQEEAEHLFATASQVESLGNAVSAVISSHRDAFFDAFSRQVQLLKSRSQAFEDGHVTVYDKVLLGLTSNGNDLDNAAAITWYCNEYLGLHGNGNNEQETRSVQQALAVESGFSQALLPSGLQPQAHTLVKDAARDSSISCKDLTSSRDDPSFKHLWSVYSKAHADYLVVAEKRDNNTLDAVKFLRDTAENGIHFLQDKYPNDPALTELTNTYNMAKATAVELHGGRKRKFDRTADSENGRQKKKNIWHTADHDRANAARRHQRHGLEGARPRRIGRGPSGIPYGYTRPVDSYYPA